ncbi:MULTISPECIES: HigA family addiction module antitoxin [unclassified Aureimonas]|uniref:HigA family addiction module antitoxin n=1 Tax=unclassified Aureimonas TaxID=2615206 RepID=UPI0006F9ACFF|nr:MULTISPECIES: HigA family addiction module antitoxin [unclassified Aureimonas]KQT52597.1 XRE family transcriptional regulator [Aureimonas sp. Leaf427]KQT77503.1 XRE family transcriptional regulator [Aureimonas sp. Leaf460]
MAIKLHGSFAVHPGAWLKTEMVEPFGLSVTSAAEKLGVTRQAMSHLLNARSGLSADMALRFEKAFGLEAETLLRMQASHDLAVARAGEKNIKVERLVAAGG